MKVLSLFDGMACGMLAMMVSGVWVDRYVAYEIDKYAVKTSSHNFPYIEHKGDVFKADFTEYRGFDFLVGGSPCTYWSIAQTKNRETVASGMGWELFSQYVRALKEAEPHFFIYENNKSMSKDIKDSITKTFGFEPICINSALVSAQNRQRLYWVGIRQSDGSYRKANVEQPKDQGILLKDILETNGVPYQDKVDVLTASYDGAVIWNSLERHQRSMVAELVKPLSEAEMDYMVRTVKGGRNHFDFGYLYDPNKDKSPCVTAGVNRVPYNVVAEPVGIKQLGTLYGQHSRWGIFDEEGKAPTLTASAGMGGGHLPMVSEPINITDDGKSQTLKAQYAKNSVSNFVGYTSTYGATGVAEPIPLNPTVDGKSHALTASYYKIAEAPISEFGNEKARPRVAIPIKTAKDIEDSKITIYEVKDGQITVKGKQYPIKLIDGYYIIRKLTVLECMRLQTVPEWYDFSCVSNSQAYKMLGNGWTISVISWLIRSVLEDYENNESIEIKTPTKEPSLDDQLTIFDVWGENP